MKHIIALILMAATMAAQAESWEIRMLLQVPRVADNAKSLGYRRYQVQKLRGCFTVERNAEDEPAITFCRLENLTHLVNGRPVTYKVTVTDVKWHGIGSNATGRFDERSVSLSLLAEPSYAIGEEPTDDNSLVICLSGRGSSGGVLSGFAAGWLGCGCHEYGHLSPTRIWSTCVVVDTAAVYGKWKARQVE